MTQIFISYRRDDTSYIADTLKDRLEETFGEGSVSYDLDTDKNRYGFDYRESIAKVLATSDVLLLVIGNQWLEAKEKDGSRRLDNPKDPVRVEIEQALQNELPIMPVLVEKAEMPSEDALPESIRAIAYKNAAPFRPGIDRRSDLERIFDALKELQAPVKKKNAAKRTQRPRKRKAPNKTTPVAEISKSPGGPEESFQKSALAFLEKSISLKEIERVLGDFTDEYLFVGAAIPSDKLNNAIGAYAPQVLPTRVLLLYDDTFFRGAKEGMILTTDAVYWHNTASDPGYKAFSEIKSVEARDGGFLGAKVLIDGSEIQIHYGDKNALARQLALVIRAMTDRLPGRK